MSVPRTSDDTNCIAKARGWESYSFDMHASLLSIPHEVSLEVDDSHLLTRGTSSTTLLYYVLITYSSLFSFSFSLCFSAPHSRSTYPRNLCIQEGMKGLTHVSPNKSPVLHIHARESSSSIYLFGNDCDVVWQLARHDQYYCNISAKVNTVQEIRGGNKRQGRKG